MAHAREARRRGSRGVSRSVRRSEDAARLHLDVRRLRHAVSERSPDDVGYAGLQLRARESRGFHPYWHARELLADGRGILVPFGDAGAIGVEIAKLLTNDVLRQAMRKRAYSSSRSMTWERTAERYMSVFENAGRRHRLKTIARSDTSTLLRDSRAPPEMQLGHFLSMCDDTGLFQHAVHSVPDRAHGYCVDDNARALLVACALNNPGEQRLPEVLTARFAAFVQHAWNPDTQAISQFHGLQSLLAGGRGIGGQPRANALGAWACARSPTPTCRGAHGPRRCFPKRCRRSKAFVRRVRGRLCCSGSMLIARPFRTIVRATRLRAMLADRLIRLSTRSRRDDWVWFEDGLAYDNARLPQALILTGIATQDTAVIVDAGSEVAALAGDPANLARRANSGRSAPQASAIDASRRRPSTSSRWRPRRPLRPASRHGAQITMSNGKPKPRASSRGFSAATTCRSPWSIWKPEAAATACIPTAPTKTAAANPWCRTLLGLSEIRQVARLSESRVKAGAAWLPDDADSHFLQLSEATLSQLPFLNRQALHLRPDPTRVIVRPFKPATEPRDLNPTDKTRANHIVERVLALDARGGGAPIGRRAGEFSRPSPQPAADLRGPRRGDGRSAGRSCRVHAGAAATRRRLFSQRIFVRGLGLVQSEHRARIPISPGRRKAAFASSSAFVPSAKAMCPP